ncbi:9776_t:CDS:2 [Cetraspora pellucida]|uniref:9776_t:CDS:1 n=1 Tax=Cetraspora pellucida TaxID=1433469 RepID=A0A9N9IWU1_9GLOM|nr:9776_t:CDS:2 [Cetraspora pellucida]
MSSFELILHGLKLSLKDFIEKHLPIESNYEIITSFIGVLTSTNDRFIDERKEELLKYFIHQFLEKNGITSLINKTLVYLNKNNMPRISNGNIDLHGQYKHLIFLIQSKCKILVKDLREFLNTISKQPETSVGFLVSNVELSDNARIELEKSPIKERICVCFYYEIVDKIFEYARIFEEKHDKLKKQNEERKRKADELKAENKFLRKQNKRLKEEFQSQIKELESQIVELKEKTEIQNQNIKKTIDNQYKEFKKQNQEMKEKLENQSKKFDKKLDLILRRFMILNDPLQDNDSTNNHSNVANVKNQDPRDAIAKMLVHN